jgi:hypothetical protein
LSIQSEETFQGHLTLTFWPPYYCRSYNATPWQNAARKQNQLRRHTDGIAKSKM